MVKGFIWTVIARLVCFYTCNIFEWSTNCKWTQWLAVLTVCTHSNPPESPFSARTHRLAAQPPIPTTERPQSDTETGHQIPEHTISCNRFQVRVPACSPSSNTKDTLCTYCAGTCT
ncbi:hypothetical protein BD777DRAFT_37578 [Yarrowia lipolytica]|nr:hypothetical protein BD777DRAFT_37578 [Yarrowia lipolytica]